MIKSSPVIAEDFFNPIKLKIVGTISHNAPPSFNTILRFQQILKIKSIQLRNTK